MRDRGQRDDEESELTLSPASLLGIFLGLVLVCGVFFGFGYSVGRRATSSGTVSASADSDAEGTDTPIPSIAKPSAARTTMDTDDTAASEDSLSSPASHMRLEPASTVPVRDVPPTTEASARGADAATAHGTLTHAAGMNGTLSIAPAAATEKASEGNPETGRTVVQVAAVTRQEDADVLVSALRQKGYRAMERSEPQDKLLHVQVGPFSSREDANTMKQKLLADGYNAIIKQ
jgi:DedD protein